VTSRTHETVDLTRVALSLLLSGIVATPLAAIAVRWPDPALVLAMVAAGGAIGTFGVFDFAAGATNGAIPSAGVFYMGHGAAMVGFGVLSVSVPVAEPGIARGLAIAWLALYAVFLALLAWRLWYNHYVRRALVTWSAVNCGLSGVLALTRPLTTLGLLYAGAAYTCALGVILIAAGLWIQHDLARQSAAEPAPAFSNRGGVNTL
jgi:hypothetical protein